VSRRFIRFFYYSAKKKKERKKKERKRERKGKQNEKEKKRTDITARSSSLCRLARFPLSLSRALNPPPSLFMRLSPTLLRRAICHRYFAHVFVTPTKYYIAFATFLRRSGASMLERHVNTSTDYLRAHE